MGPDFRPYDDVAFVMPPRKRIALAAWPSRRDPLCVWANRNADFLSLHDLCAPMTLAVELEKTLDVPVARLPGGDEVVGPIAALIADARVDMLICFCDTEASFAASPTLSELLRCCVAWNVPFACNATSADFLLTSPLMLGDYAREVPEFTEMQAR